MKQPLSNLDYRAGRLRPVWTIEIQTVPADVDRILDAIVSVDRLTFGQYDRNASVSAIGYETAQPRAGATTDVHVEDFQPGETEAYPVVEVTVSLDRDPENLADVLEAVAEVHHYEEPVIVVREAWASTANYNPNNNNPNRWWNNGRGLPERIQP